MLSHCRSLALVGILGAIAWSTTASAQAAPDVSAGDTPVRSALTEAPTVAYAYSAHGASAHTIGAQTYGLGLAGRGDGHGAMVGGGISVWGAPIDRLTLVGDASRDSFGQFAPSAA